MLQTAGEPGHNKHLRTEQNTSQSHVGEVCTIRETVQSQNMLDHIDSKEKEQKINICRERNSHVMGSLFIDEQFMIRIINSCLHTDV